MNTQATGYFIMFLLHLVYTFLFVMEWGGFTGPAVPFAVLTFGFGGMFYAEFTDKSKTEKKGGE